MNEIAKCPICWDDPKVKGPDPGYYDLKTYHCCGHASYADTPEEWNKYSAAMELAKATVAYRKVLEWSDLPPVREALDDAKQRVWELFK